MSEQAVILAGVPTRTPHLYRKIHFNVGDTVVRIELPGRGSFAILRDIEMDRAREARIADKILCPEDLKPEGGLSGDRDTANAQAAAELLTREGVSSVVTDRSLPMLFAHYLQERGIEVACDPEMGVLERRAKSDREVEALRQAQEKTEQAMRMACELIGGAEAHADGTLRVGPHTLTSEYVKSAINKTLLDLGMGASHSIVAGGPAGADPHNRGAGPLRTGEPVIVDIFPQDPETLYWGDCTRTVVHGVIPDTVAEMHEAVQRAKKAAIDATKEGVTGEEVHQAACAVLEKAGYSIGIPSEDEPETAIKFVHGTGHGIGLELHEPPLLAAGGPELVIGDALTVEPGLYCRAIGGIRIEDMVIVREGGSDNLNSLPEGLSWP